MGRATQMERIIAKGQLLAVTFTAADVAASQTNAGLALATGGDGYAMPFEFEVVAVSVHSNAARTAGTLAVEAMIDTSATGLIATLDATNTINHQATLTRGSKVGAAGATVKARITTAAGWTPTTADITVTVFVLVHLEGI